MSKKTEKEIYNNSKLSSTKDSEENKPDTRRIFLFGRLENEVALPVIKKLLRLAEKDDKAPIDLFINSSGGNGYNADAIIAVINKISAPVNTICLGHALSGACEVLASGTGKRSAYEFSTLMFHQTLWEADGDITNLEIQAKQGQKFREAQVELLHRCSGKDKKTLRHDIERDYYLSATEALDYGLIDEVIYFKRPKNNNNSNSKSSSSLDPTLKQAPKLVKETNTNNGAKQNLKTKQISKTKMSKK